MEETPFGLIEIVLAFSGLLAWAVWELVRTRRGLARLKRERAAKAR